jgi:hypothetical protein
MRKSVIFFVVLFVFMFISKVNAETVIPALTLCGQKDIMLDLGEGKKNHKIVSLLDCNGTNYLPPVKFQNPASNCATWSNGTAIDAYLSVKYSQYRKITSDHPLLDFVKPNYSNHMLKIFTGYPEEKSYKNNAQLFYSYTDSPIYPHLNNEPQLFYDGIDKSFVTMQGDNFFLEDVHKYYRNSDFKHFPLSELSTMVKTLRNRYKQFNCPSCKGDTKTIDASIQTSIDKYLKKETPNKLNDYALINATAEKTEELTEHIVYKTYAGIADCLQQVANLKNETLFYSYYKELATDAEVRSAIDKGYVVRVDGSWSCQDGTKLISQNLGNPYYDFTYYPYIADDADCGGKHSFIIAGYIKSPSNKYYYIIHNSHGESVKENLDAFSKNIDDEGFYYKRGKFRVLEAPDTVSPASEFYAKRVFNSYHIIKDIKYAKYKDIVKNGLAVSLKSINNDQFINNQDMDKDGVLDLFDNCPNKQNLGQVDNDITIAGQKYGDYVGSACDYCPKLYDRYQLKTNAMNPSKDQDNNGIADVCDSDPPTPLSPPRIITIGKGPGTIMINKDTGIMKFTDKINITAELDIPKPDKYTNQQMCFCHFNISNDNGINKTFSDEVNKTGKCSIDIDYLPVGHNSIALSSKCILYNISGTPVTLTSVENEVEGRTIDVVYITNYHNNDKLAPEAAITKISKKTYGTQNGQRAAVYVDYSTFDLNIEELDLEFYIYDNKLSTSLMAAKGLPAASLYIQKKIISGKEMNEQLETGDLVSKGTIAFDFGLPASSINNTYYVVFVSRDSSGLAKYIQSDLFNLAPPQDPTIEDPSLLLLKYMLSPKEVGPVPVNNIIDDKDTIETIDKWKYQIDNVGHSGTINDLSPNQMKQTDIKK